MYEYKFAFLITFESCIKGKKPAVGEVNKT